MNLKYKSQLTFFLVGLLLMIGCSSKLNREEAKDMIMEHKGYPKPYIYELSTSNNISSDSFDSDRKENNYLLERGLITVDSSLVDASYRQLSVFNVQVTDLGKMIFEGPFLYNPIFSYPNSLIDTTDDGFRIWKARLCDIGFAEITGITQDEQTATVEYTTNLVNLNLSIEELIYLSPLSPRYRKYKFKINMIKYDDGWRIDKR